MIAPIFAGFFQPLVERLEVFQSVATLGSITVRVVIIGFNLDHQNVVARCDLDEKIWIEVFIRHVGFRSLRRLVRIRERVREMVK